MAVQKRKSMANMMYAVRKIIKIITIRITIHVRVSYAMLLQCRDYTKKFFSVRMSSRNIIVKCSFNFRSSLPVFYCRSQLPQSSQFCGNEFLSTVPTKYWTEADEVDANDC